MAGKKNTANNTTGADAPVKKNSEMSQEELIEALKAELKAEQAKNEDLTATVSEQDGVIQDLNKAVATSGKGPKKIVVKHDGKSYQVVPKSFQLDKKIVTAESLTKNADLVKQLVEMNSGHLKPIE